MKAFSIGFVPLMLFAFTPLCNASVQFGDGGASLQSILDGITVGGPSGIDVTNDEFTPDEYWSITGSGGSVSTIIVELAGFAGSNTMSIYDRTDASKTVQLFSGAGSAGDQALVSIMLDGSVIVNFVDSGVDFAGNLFGFLLTTPEYLFYTDPSLNADGADHVATYQGNGDTIQVGGFAPGIFTSSEYIFAFEDMPDANGDGSPGDGDFNDFVFIVESISPVPEPGTIAVWAGLGAIGLLAGRRQFAKTA